MLYDLRILVLLKLFSGKKMPIYFAFSAYYYNVGKAHFQSGILFPIFEIFLYYALYVQLKVPPPVFISCEIRRSIILVDFLITSIKCNSRWQINLPSGNFFYNFVSEVHTTKKLQFLSNYYSVSFFFIINYFTYVMKSKKRIYIKQPFGLRNSIEIVGQKIIISFYEFLLGFCYTPKNA